jgi:choline dehydrogenase-like flavoprotein
MGATTTAAGWDYVIVGSGAGGGALAARLAEAGMRVFLLEAGGDARSAPGARMPADYDVPAFHAFASENDAMSWGFRVRHYADEARQARDPKYRRDEEGVLYPRAAALGGCTAHNAMIYMLPHDSDWNEIARLTGDESWSAQQMRRYARRLEDCHHRPFWRWLQRFGLNLSGHGFGGWLRTEQSAPHDALSDRVLAGVLLGTASSFVSRLPQPLLSTLRWLRGHGDPNAKSWSKRSFQGLCYLPLSTSSHRRTGARERLLAVAARYPERLHIELDALATRVLFDADGAAEGVAYLKGARLYRAHANTSALPGEQCEVRARREVILCGGAFNTPQLLMLSGIGPGADLRAHGIATRVDLPGVGRNLQDRYEVAVTYRMLRPWDALAGARFETGDPLWQRWNAGGAGLYGSNGAALAVVRRSQDSAAEPDVLCMALLARFEGYFPGFSNWIRQHPDYLTWSILKGHTRNRAGRVTLRSADPRDTPHVNFHYFEEGDDSAGEDLQAVVGAIEFVRTLTRPLIELGLIAEERSPGPAVQGAEALADYVRNSAWGHHASCSCPIGDRAQGGVLDSRFAVHGTRRLRVVDASVFPRIPGFFLASAVYMIGEKAADILLEHGAPARAEASSTAAAAVT